MPAKISSVAHYVPPQVIPNTYFEEFLDTNDEWIVTRTGIKERRFAKGGATSDLIVPAALEAIKKRGIDKQEIDTVLVATVTPDHMFPSTAAIVQHKLGLKKAWGYDISAACSGFLFTLITAAKLVESGASKKVLVCGADKMSSIMNFQDRSHAILFGDGAGVVIVEKSEDESGILDHILNIDGDGGKHLIQVSGGSYDPASEESVQGVGHYIHQEGQPVFKAAVKGMADVSKEIMDKNGLTSDDISWLVPHQANLRIIDATGKRMGLSPDKVMINISRYGNTTAATIPICLSEWHTEGKLKKGQNIVLSSFGAGFTWGSILVNWSI
jgi:3-oxoacyl-[acyl-carrier-protein] synthase-3